MSSVKCTITIVFDKKRKIMLFTREAISPLRMVMFVLF